MTLYLIAMAVTILSNIAYHFFQKSIDPQVHPLVSLSVTYAVALAVTLLALPFVKGSTWAGWSSWTHVNWASYALGFAAVGLEIGFLLAYRAGWQVSVAALYSNIWVTVLLIPVGMAFFGETMGPRKGVGLLLALAGLWILGKK